MPDKEPKDASTVFNKLIEEVLVKPGITPEMISRITRNKRTRSDFAYELGRLIQNSAMDPK